MGSGSCKQKSSEDAVDSNLKGYDAGPIEDYQHNGIKEIKINDNFTVLVSEFEGKYYGYGSKCPHYGAPLVDGALVDGMIKCPWHGACFDIRTGDIEDHPGLNCIPTYRVNQSKTGHLTVYPKNIGEIKIERPMSKTKDQKCLAVVIGGGAAGLIFAQTLREKSFQGRILMISKDAYLPYDRTKLSQSPGIPWQDIKLRDEGWYSEAQVEVMLNANVERVDLESKTIYIEDNTGKPLTYNKLLIATGLRPRIPLKGAYEGWEDGVKMKNVLTLHSLKDSARIKEKTAGKEIVIVGSGFIAMELSTSLQPSCKKITILSRYKRPYGPVLGETVGRLIQRRIIGKYSNVRFIGCEEVRKFVANGAGEVEKVISLKGKEIPCEAVIYAIGGVPNSECVSPPKINMPREEEEDRSPLNCTSSGFIPTNEFMETDTEDVWAAGDVARIPLNISVTRWASVSHWGMAQKTGRVAALSVMGIKESIFNTVPFYWSTVAGISIRYVGYGEHYNQSLIFGDLVEMRFCVVYKRDVKILALCTCNCDPIAAKMAFDMQDEIDFGEGFPSYIIEAFPNPPLIGEVIEGIRFNVVEERIVEWDANQHRIKNSWVDRRAKYYEDDEHKDREFPLPPPVGVKRNKLLLTGKADPNRANQYYENTNQFKQITNAGASGKPPPDSKPVRESVKPADTKPVKEAVKPDNKPKK